MGNQDMWKTLATNPGAWLGLVLIVTLALIAFFPWEREVSYALQDMTEEKCLAYLEDNSDRVGLQSTDPLPDEWYTGRIVVLKGEYRYTEIIDSEQNLVGYICMRERI